MPSQHQVKWAQLRVGITVIIAAAVLAVLIFLMTGTSGFFTHKIVVYAYFDNAGGLRVGAPVDLQGVSVGNVSDIRVVPDHGTTPVQISMRILKRAANQIPSDAIASLNQAGVLGETYVDIDRRFATSAETIHDGSILKIADNPNIQDVIRASQSSLQNVDILVKRLDHIVSYIDSGKGSIGKLIYDQELYNRLNATLNQVQGMVNDISSGKGSIGKLIANDELYNKANQAVDSLNQIIDQIQAGQGTVGKLIKDPSLYNNANETIAKANQLMSDVNSGKGALGKLAKDQEFANKLDNTITKLSAVMTELEAGQGTAGQFIKNPSLYNNADQMLLESRQLLKSIRENPKKYLTIKLHIF